MTPKSPDYDELSLLLQQSHLLPSAAEAHGMLCGLLAGHTDQAAERWIMELFAEFPGAEIDVETLSDHDGDGHHRHGPECGCGHDHGQAQLHDHDHDHDCEHEHAHEHGTAHSFEPLPIVQAKDLLATAFGQAEGKDRPDKAPASPDPETRLREALKSMADLTERALGADGLELQPLLPDDEQPLNQRALAATEWTRGLLFGLGLAAIDRQALEAETREAFDDLLELTRMDLEDLNEDAEHEEALSDVVEFLRVATLLIHDDIATQARNASQH